MKTIFSIVAIFLAVGPTAAKKPHLGQKISTDSKDTKDSQKSELVRVAFGEQHTISGTTTEQTGDSSSHPECSPENEEWNDGDDCDCFDDPFFVNRETGDGSTFVHDDVDHGTTAPFTFADPPLGDGAICGGAFDGTTASDKFTLECFGDVTDDLLGRPVKHLQSVECSCWVESCPVSTSCPEWFYLNICAREHATSNVCWHDCRFDFTPPSGGDIGTWTTFKLENIKDITPGDTDGVNCRGATTIQDCIDAVAADDSSHEAVLGNLHHAFTLNIGDSKEHSNGVSGCYDNLHVLLNDEEAIRIYDFEQASRVESRHQEDRKQIRWFYTIKFHFQTI
jgi:hypothetical protein